MSEPPEVLENIRRDAKKLIRKWGPRDVLVLLSGTDHAKITAYMNREHGPGGPPEPEGPSFTMNFEPKPGLQDGDYILAVEDKDDDRDSDLIEI